MNYNVYIREIRDKKFLLSANMEELQKLVEAFEKGKDHIILPGREKILLKGLSKLAIYEAGDHVEKEVRDILNRTADYLGRIAMWKESQLEDIGKNITSDFITCDYGEGQQKTIELTNIFDQLTSDFFHAEVMNVSAPLFASGHYKQAAQEAAVGVISRVRSIYKDTTKENLDGKPLMMAAFNEDNPVIMLFEEHVNDWKGLQEGYKFIFSGLVMAIRNPKAHANFDIDKVDAIELLFLCSRLHKKLDNAVE